MFRKITFAEHRNNQALRSQSYWSAIFHISWIEYCIAKIRNSTI